MRCCAPETAIFMFTLVRSLNFICHSQNAKTSLDVFAFRAWCLLYEPPLLTSKFRYSMHRVYLFCMNVVINSGYFSVYH
jgi:hypothetical protein